MMRQGVKPMPPFRKTGAGREDLAALIGHLRGRIGPLRSRMKNLAAQNGCLGKPPVEG